MNVCECLQPRGRSHLLYQLPAFGSQVKGQHLLITQMQKRKETSLQHHKLEERFWAQNWLQDFKTGPKLDNVCGSPNYWMCHWTERNKVVLGACIKVEIESESRVVLFAFVIVEIGSESFTKIRSVHKDEKLSFQYCLSLVRARLWLSAKLRGKRKPGYGSLLATLENANGHSDPIFETNPVTKSSHCSDCVMNIIFGLYCHG